MKSTAKQLGKLAGMLILITVIFFVTCEGPMGLQGDPGTHGNTPWICVDGFWHIGGIPDACNDDCTGIAATGGTTTVQSQLSITEPNRTTYCKGISFSTAGLSVGFIFGDTLIPIPATNYVLIWSEGLLTGGSTAVTAETGTKTIYVVDFSGRVGEFEITVLEHAVSTTTPATCTTASAPGVCTNEHCNVTDAVTPALGHNFSTTIPATCLADSVPGICARDGCDVEDTVVLALGHSPGSWTTVIPATCLTAGTDTLTCTRDGCGIEIDTRTNTALGHSFVIYNSNNNASCGIDGTKTSICARESCTETDTITDTGTALSHSFSPTIPATCLADSKPGICTHVSCDVTNPEAVVPALGHAFSTIFVTCTEDSILGICSRAGCGAEDIVVSVIQHNVLNGIITTPPNFATSTPGVETGTCSTCGVNGEQPYPIRAIGDIGPGGGIIFFVADGITQYDNDIYEGSPFTMNGFTDTYSGRTLYYLEASLEIFEYIQWSTTIYNVATGTAIGTGRNNTALMIAGGTAPAALVCRDYNGGGKNDWFLPSKDELNQIFKFEQGFIDNLWEHPWVDWSFWSSSQNDLNRTWVQYIQGGSGAHIGDYAENKTSGDDPYYQIYNQYLARPIRAF